MNKLVPTLYALFFIAGGCSQGTREEPANYTSSGKAATGLEHGKAPPPKALSQGVAAPTGDHPSGDSSKSDHPTGDHPSATKKSKQGDGTKAFGPFLLDIPNGWIEEAPSMSMRFAQYKLNDANLVVYYFGKSGAGGVKANMDRWIGQFTQADGSESASIAKIEEKTQSGFKITTIALEGMYGASMGPNAPKSQAKEMAMLGAIIESSDGPYYFKLVGPKQTIKSKEAEFKKSIMSIRAI